MRLSIIIPVLNSHEIIRRQILFYKRMNLPDNVEIIYVDDGSEPPIRTIFYKPSGKYESNKFIIVETNDKRPWTWALARNKGAKEAKGKYLLMTDVDYIIPKKSIEDALAFDGDYMGFRREFGILDVFGYLYQNKKLLKQYGLPDKRMKERGFKLAPHPNNFVIRKELFFEMGGYREDLIGKDYPQGEDNWFKKTRHQWIKDGKLIQSEHRPLLYMFPNGRYCGDVDYNPFGLFHNLSRKSKKNPFMKNERFIHNNTSTQ